MPKGRPPLDSRDKFSKTSATRHLNPQKKEKPRFRQTTTNEVNWERSNAGGSRVNLSESALSNSAMSNNEYEGNRKEFNEKRKKEKYWFMDLKNNTGTQIS